MQAECITIAGSALVCAEAKLDGNVQIDEGCVLHPGSIITGCVSLGKHNIVEDYVKIGSESDLTQTHSITIGDENLFECGCAIGSIQIGNSNLFESKAVAKKGSIIGSNCIIGQCVVIEEGERIEDGTIITGATDDNNQLQRIFRKMQPSLLIAHQKTIQRYANTLRNSNGPSALTRHHRMRAIPSISIT